MAYIAVSLPAPKNNNPITLLLMRKGKSKAVDPPVGSVFLADENNRLLRDERGAYLIENKED